MKKTILATAAACGLLLSLQSVFAQGTAFTYQGRLNDGINPANGKYDLNFALFNASNGPSQVGSTIPYAGIGVSNGLFTVVLDFGANFPGADRWLEIAVHTNGAASFVTLSPRQKIVSAPYAIQALNAGNLGGQPPGAFAPVSGSSTYVAKAGDTMTGTLQINRSPSGVGLFVGNRTPFGQALFETDIATSGTHAWFAEGGTNVFSVTGGGNGYFKGSLTINGSLYGTANGILDVEAGITASGQVIGNSTALDGSGGGIQGYGYRIGTVGTASRGVIGESYNNTGVYGESVVATGVEGTSTEGWGVYGHSQNNTGVYGSTAKAGPTYAGVFGDNTVAGGTGVVGRGLAVNSAGVAGVADAAGSTGVYGRGTVWAGYFDGNVSVCTLTIRGGCDVAEPFQMSTKELPKGTVVVIDDENAGQLTLSDRAYDHRVAGIVSGANGINPGISLHQEGALESGQNVALSGRVYVLADASTSSIKPGDLLTTSDLPGHAMKVTDPARAQGAILGKAMSSLKEGTGLVLVLVTLQ